MSHHKNGAVDSSKTVKAGCGIRYDPEVLGEDSGFDFSNVANLKPHNTIYRDLMSQSSNGKESESQREDSNT